MCPLLKAWIVHENEYVYSEGDDIKVMYFNPNNCVSYVLPTFLNREYVCVSKGNDFGLTDLVYAIYNSSKTKKDFLDTYNLLSYSKETNKTATWGN